MYQGDDLFFVFYLNTNTYDPRLITDYVFICYDAMTFEEEWHCAIGNILNLKISTIVYDEASKLATFKLSNDLAYVLTNYETYVLPIQEEGCKVCISIQGGGTGLGFCNLTDDQISDFVSQVMEVMNTYPLDGINLWDKNSGYGTEGMPAMNTTSYPKLIKALREALGDDKLLTITDYEEPTEYFWDTEATGGIEVGDYIDYAWSGYNTRSEGVQIVDPYHQGESMVSSLHPRKPIAGLDPKKYGCLNLPWGTKEFIDTESRIIDWATQGYNPNNIILSEDMRTNLQDALESVWHQSLFLTASDLSLDTKFYVFDGYYLEYQSYYGKWLKDW